MTIDLKQLAVQRNAPPAVRRTPWLTRYVLPAAVGLGFLGVVGWAARDHLTQARPVTVVPVLSTERELRQEGTPLFQSAGWVEPRPTPTMVTALAEGVIDRLLVVENQEVRAGQAVATLIDADAKLAVQAAEAERRLRQADCVAASANFAGATTNFEKPAALEAALAEAEALLAQKETEQASLPFALRTARARRDVARLNAENKQKAGSIPELQRQEAIAEREATEAAVGELESKQTRLVREVEAMKTRRDALKRRLDLRADEARLRAESSAMCDAADARLQLADNALAVARLRLERMTVRSPSAGRVLALVGRPGGRVMGQGPQTAYDASTVVTLYDPLSLQVRADVRLENVPQVRPGQAVRIETPAAPGGPLEGVVLFAASQADIQKNTLQAKVAITSPPMTLRPDMLVQVTFLAPSAEPGDRPPSATRRLLAPRSLVEGGSRVWVADQAAGVARQRTVTLGATTGDWVEVVDGLTAGDRLIAAGREGLADGQRVRVTGEEPTPAGGVHGTR